MIKRIVFCILLILFSSSYAIAGDLVQWHSTNVQLLKGWEYEVGEEERAIVTLEHVNGWKYGDLFAFVDVTRFDSGGTTAYGEFSPRFSFSKITGKELSFGLIKDVLLATTYEKGKGDTRAYLYGGAVDLDIPGFTFFQTNMYVRDNPEIQHDETWQVTIAWKKPFGVGGQKFLFEGFADFAGEEGLTYDNNQLVVPRLLWDVGNAVGREEGQIYGGVEWQYWHNKFGIDGVSESVPQMQLKWVF